MSRVGKTIIQLPSEVKVTLMAAQLEAQGKLGRLSYNIPDLVSVVQDGSSITVKPQNETQEARSLWGTTQRNIANMIRGVDKGFTRNLELIGVGYRAQVQGNDLILQLGYSHEIKYRIPAGIAIKCEKPTSIEVSGASKQSVGQVAAEIRAYRKPEPYKGKGVIRQGEFVIRKEGKKK
ncbi:MAG: 50S ribosomal protein L6 [Alphaproteobacteria bacterium]